jgi:hypothetical protein
LRHDTILYVKQAACTGGCILEERPRIVAYVEPKPDVFRRVERLATELRDTSRTKTVFHAEVDRKLLRLAGLAGRLGRIADGELHGFELADSDAAFCKGLGITLESIVTFSDSFAQAYSAEEVQKAPPKQVESAGPGRDTLSGDVRAVVARAARVSRGRQYNEDLRMATVADVHTDLNSGLVLEEAVGDPCKLYAVIPCRGSSYLAVGACYSYYEFTKPMSERMTDAEWQQLRPKPPMPEWTGSFIAR